MRGNWLRKSSVLGVAIALCATIGSAGAIAEEAAGGLGATVEAGAAPEVAQSTRTATLPETVTNEDGTVTQRTPSEYPELKLYYYPQMELDGSFAYNIQLLDTDNRGCNACHTDLADAVQQIGYSHVDLRNNYGINITVQMCKDCHEVEPALHERHGFGEMIHTIHMKSSSAFTGTCESCHAVKDGDSTMYLFDEVKYDMYRGVVDLANVQGEFSYSQDELTTLADLWDFPWYYYDNDYTREENEEAGLPLDQDLFDSWTITVTGAVGQEVTFSLKDMVDAGWGEDVVLTGICTMNPQGGPLVANLPMKGIPIQRLLDEAGVNEGATGFYTVSIDGYGYGTDFADFGKDHGGYLVYEIEGQPLSWRNGYPVTYWVQGSSSAGSNAKQVSDVIVSDEPLPPSWVLGNLTEEGLELAGSSGNVNEGHAARDGEESTEVATNNDLNDGALYTNKPCAGVMGTPEGLVVPVGEPYTFHGYADGYEQAVVAVEFSMDNGVTWTRYETPGTTSNNWVTWDFTFVPEARGAYVFSVRAVTETGMVTAEPVKVMINAKEA